MRKKSKGDTWDGIFADPEVGRVLKSKRLIADANKSSIEELSQITSLNPRGSWDTGYFYNNTVITKFPELKYCTGLSDLKYAFYECSNLTEVTIPEGVTNMRQTFTYCTSLVKAPIIPDSVTDMTDIFYDCSSLNGIFIIKPIDPPRYNNAFLKTNVVAIYVPDESVSKYKTATGWRDHSSKIKPISQLPE